MTSPSRAYPTLWDPDDPVLVVLAARDHQWIRGNHGPFAVTLAEGRAVDKAQLLSIEGIAEVRFAADVRGTDVRLDAVGGRYESRV